MAERTVMKFGGSILSSSADLQRIASLVKKRRESEEICIVVSALKGVTDSLIEASENALEDNKSINSFLKELREKHFSLVEGLETEKAKQVATEKLNQKFEVLERVLFGINYLAELSERSKALAYTFGERLSAILVEAYLLDAGLEAESMDASKAIVTDGNFAAASPLMDKTAKKSQQLGKMLPEKVVVVTGYLGADSKGNTTCFGRGGSDFSAGILANVLNAGSLELWKDVDGFMSADPKAVPKAKLLKLLSYEEAEELGYFGAKILHPRTIVSIREREIRAVVKNIHSPEKEGTVISAEKERHENVVKSIATRKQIASVCVRSAAMVGVSGALAQMFDALSKAGISVDTVATSETGVSITVNESDADAAKKALEACPIQFDSIEVEKDVAAIGLIGEGMKGVHSLSGRLFSALGNSNINIEMISQGGSEINISFLVKQKDLGNAVKAIHCEFME